MTSVALLGLGRMGAPMAQRLQDAGHELTGWNRTPRPERLPTGARTARTPAEAAAGAEVVVTMLADAAALRDALDGPEGALGTLGPGAVLVDMGTIGPDAAREVAAACERVDAAFVDAPVSGSVPAAQSGGLLAMVGGGDVAVARARPVLDVLCREVRHLGDVGSGQAMKLAVNAMLAVTNQAIGELLAQASAAGIRREDAYDVLADSAVGSPFVGYKREAFLRPDEAPVAFAVGLMAKDVALALEQAARLDAPAALAEAAADALAAALARGAGGLDFSRVVRPPARA